VRAWLDAADAQVMIHGHTHLPANHDLGGGRQRIVLSDWDLAAHPPRQEVLRIGGAGAQRIA
jgi:UDP-2,3-diacylglucosamine hydrolase